MTVPDLGFPDLKTFESLPGLVRAIKKRVREAIDKVGLKHYSFYAVFGEPLKLFIDEETLDVAVVGGVEKGRTGRTDLEHMTELEDGRLPAVEEVEQSEGEFSWDSFGDFSL